jgi:hypothetical protein
VTRHVDDPTALVPRTSGALQPWIERSALEQLPRRQAFWIAGSTAAALLAALFPLWALQPEIALTLALGAGASLVDLRRLWAAPLVIAGVGLAGLICAIMGWPAVIGAGAAAGAFAAWLYPHRTDGLDVVHGSLGGLAGSSIGLWVATTLLPGALPAAIVAPLTVGIVALLGSQALLPVAFRFDHAPQIPSIRQVQKALKVSYRPPVFRAIDLYTHAETQAPDAETRRGMAEVTTWVFRLQVTLQTLDNELGLIDPEQVRQRIAQAREASSPLATGPAGAVSDAFTRERRAATAAHLERLLEHRQLIEVERGRTEADVEYSLAFLEEARASLALAQQLPGETVPDRLPEVLRRLREHATDGQVRRRTAHELGAIQV